MTHLARKRFIHSKRRGKYSRERSLQMNKARWDADRERRKAGESERLAELSLRPPITEGSVLGVIIWHDALTGEVKKWRVKRGDRTDRVILQSPDGRQTKSHGWTWVMMRLRKWFSGSR